MNRNIYNDDRFNRKRIYIKIRNLNASNKYNSVVREASKYLELYPDDSNIRFMRANAYRKLEMFSLAISDLKYNLEKGIDLHSLTALYFLYYFLNMYEEALKILPIVYETKCIKPHSVYITEIVMKKKLGIDMRIKDGDRCDYLKSQIIEYDINSAIDHVKEHVSCDNVGKSGFRKNVNLEYLFEFIKDSIPKSKKVNTEEVLEVYYFGISNIGYCNNNFCNALKVVVAPNTNNIITMYPIENTEYNCLNNIEIDYDKLFKQKNKVKIKSRIDMFNEKYNIK